jgi:hypothetical protein
MRKIQPRNVHPRFQQPLQNAWITRCRADRANNFGVSKIHSLCTATILPSTLRRRIAFFFLHEMRRIDSQSPGDFVATRTLPA